jgi:hypothetical protein
MDISTINWLAVLVAAISNFIIGGLWYSPLMFYKSWAKEINFSDQDVKNRNMARIFTFSFLWSVVMSLNLAFYLNDKNTDAKWGATAGFLAGFGWVAMAIFILGLFENKTLRYMLINAGYMVVSFIVMGVIIGAWR